MQRTIKIKNYEIIYTLLIKKVKNINLHINKQGQIIVSCNAYIPLEEVDRFVINHFEWIIKNVNEILRKKAILEDKTSYIFLGKRYKIQIKESNISHIKIQDKTLYIYKKEKENEQKLIYEFENKTLQQIIQTKSHKLYQKMYQDYRILFPTIRIRSMKSKWGSCEPRKNVITFNHDLIHYDEKFIEYVIIHEFAHLVQPNHSKAFYYVIEKYMPDYRQIKELGPKLIDIYD
ncbi:MAG: M48 family metallopeptidase [Traorella sp.]